jgi:DNA-binding HxlR family transcriptional regulator
MSVGIDSRVKYRRPLNNDQVNVLEWLYRVRFSTSKQVAAMLKKSSHKTIQNKLQILEEQGLISKRYDKSYKLAGRAAEYYLTPAGARSLEARYKAHDSKEKLEPSVVKSLYKNKTVSEAFVAHCLLVADTIRTLKNIYGEGLLVYPRASLAGYDQFPIWRPDIYLSIKKPGGTKQYMLDVWDDSKPFFVGVRKIRNYLNHQENEGWLDNDNYPCILTICKDPKNQKKLNKQIKKAINETGNEYVMFATTTLEKLNNATKPTNKIWSKIDEYEESEDMTLKNLYANS